MDCGCGIGRWAYLLHRTHSVVGFDLYRPYLLEAKKYEEVALATATALPFRKDAFETGLAIELIEHLPKQDGFRFLEELKTVISNRVILTTPKTFIPISFGGDHPETHRSLWKKEEILGVLVAGDGKGAGDLLERRRGPIPSP